MLGPLLPDVAAGLGSAAKVFRMILQSAALGLQRTLKGLVDGLRADAGLASSELGDTSTLADPAVVKAIDGRPVRGVASQGQHRAVTLALKSANIRNGTGGSQTEFVATTSTTRGRKRSKSIPASSRICSTPS